MKLFYMDVAIAVLGMYQIVLCVLLVLSSQSANYPIKICLLGSINSGMQDVKDFNPIDGI